MSNINQHTNHKNLKQIQTYFQSEQKDTSKMRSHQENPNFQKKRDKRTYYKNEHDQQKFFSIQRNQNQPSRHFSPEKQYLELPIVNNGNQGCNNQKHINDLKNALYQTRKFRSGSLYDNYYPLIEQIKKRRNLDEDEEEVEEYTHQTNECNKNKILANALLNMNQTQIQQKNSNQQTCFNLDIHLWSNRQKKNLNNSQFILSPLPQYSSSVCNKRNKKTRNISLPQNVSGLNNNASDLFNQTLQNTNTSLLSKKKEKNNSGSRKFINYQSSLSPKKESIFDDNLELKKSIVTIPKKKILEINFASRFNRKMNDNKKTFQLMATPYIDQAIQIIEEKQTLDQNEEDDTLFNFTSKNQEKKVDIQKDPFIKIDGGYGDYVLRFHHIKQRIQNKLIPQKVPLPQQKKLFKTYEDYEQDQQQQQIQHQLDLLMQKDQTPSESITNIQPDEIIFKV